MIFVGDGVFDVCIDGVKVFVNLLLSMCDIDGILLLCVFVWFVFGVYVVNVVCGVYFVEVDLFDVFVSG